MDLSKLLQWLQQAPLELEKDHLASALLRTFLNLTGQQAGVILLQESEGFRLTVCETGVTLWHDVVVPQKMMGELATLDSPLAVDDNGDPVAQSARSLAEFLRMQSSGALRLTPTLVVPLRAEPDLRGIVVLGSDSDSKTASETAPAFSEDDLVALRAMAGQTARALQNAERFEQFAATFRSFMEIVADAIDAKDPHGQGHSRSVSYYSAAIAQQMGLSLREINAIEVAGLLHDLGRLGIPDGILLKTGRLTDEEIFIVRSYPVRGADLLMQVRGMEAMAPLVRHHAERFDGKGYPDQLRGSDIPLGARVLAAAHSFVAMISHRSYRAPMNVVGGALKALDGMAGQELDPDVVRAFLASLGRGH